MVAHPPVVESGRVGVFLEQQLLGDSSDLLLITSSRLLLPKTIISVAP